MGGLNLGVVMDEGSQEREEYAEAKEVMTVGQSLDLAVVRPQFEDYRKEAIRIATDAKALTVQDDETLNLAVMIGGNAKKITKAIDTQRKKTILEPKAFVDGVNALCRMITDTLAEAEATTKAKISQHQARVEMERRKQEEAARKAAAELQAKLQKEADDANRKAREEAARLAEEATRKRLAEEAEERRAIQEESQTEAEARAKKEAEEIEASRKKAEEEARKHEIEAPTVIAPVIPQANKVTHTESGSSYQVKRWVCTVENQLIVPREYCEPSKKLLDEAVKMGMRIIPGVRIFEETDIRFRA